MIPPYRDKSEKDSESPWASTERGVPPDIALGPDGKTSLICALRVGYDDEKSEPYFAHAISSRFLAWLRESDTEGRMRNIVADEFEQMAAHWRNGDVFRE